MKLNEFPRVQLGFLPTPLHELPRLAEEIGLERLYVKRDDNTGLAMGGNKARKLEFLLGQASADGVDIILACGGWQSNHTRMCAAAARKLGMDCMIFVPQETMPTEFDGNLLLDALFDAEVRFLPNIGFLELDAFMQSEADRLRKLGRKPLVIPMGGSTPLGSLGYVEAMQEIAGQLKDIGIEDPYLMVAVGSGGTYAGITVGTSLYLPKATPLGILVVVGTERMMRTVTGVAAGAAELLGIPSGPEAGYISLFDQYVGEEYGIPTESGRQAILLAARSEGLLLDPVYTGKAAAGMIDLVRTGYIDKKRPVVFWHTGGLPVLFPYRDMFQDEGRRLAREE